MEQDTDIGGNRNRFPDTHHSAIIAARSDNAEVRTRAFSAIIESYWKPAYKYIRIKWHASNEDAKDLTQGFFTTAFEKRFFDTYDHKLASFQTFIRTCLDRFVTNQKKSEQRLKRGGGVEHLSLDFGEAENELFHQAGVSELTPEDFFQREWVRSLFSLAVETLRQHYAQKGSDVYFQLFERYDLRENNDEKISYASLADEFGLTSIEVTNYLAAARRQFRKLVLTRLRELTASEEEFQREARGLLGVEIK